MSELTEKQKNVLDLIDRGFNTIDLLSSESGLSKSALNPVVNALVSKGIVAKDEKGIFTITPSIKEEVNNSATNENPAQEIEQTVQNHSIKVIVPYVKSEGLGDALKYALRSWDKNFKEDIQIIVVGDHEDWFSPEIIHIPHEPHLITEVCNCPIPAQILNPQADITHKVLTAITAENIQGGFILSGENIFLLGETSLFDVLFLKAFVSDLNKSGEGKGLYAQNSRITAVELLKNNLPTVRYSTNTPTAFDSDKLVEVIEKYNATEHGFILESLYFNEESPNARPILLDGAANDPILASIYRSDINPDILKQAISTRKFLNCDSKGWIAVEPHLKTMFPNPSRYEKD